MKKERSWVRSPAHRHLRKIDWLMAYTACLVCFISTASGHSKKAKNALGKCGASFRDITKLEQSIFFWYLCPNASNKCLQYHGQQWQHCGRKTLSWSFVPWFKSGQKSIKMLILSLFNIVPQIYTIKILTTDFVYAYNFNRSHCSLVVKREKINEKERDPGFAPQLIDI